MKLGYDSGAAAILGGHHHRLELLEVDVSVTVGIDGLDHVAAFIDRALEAKVVEREVEPRDGDKAIFVMVVEIHRR